jgi:alpha-amylase
VMSNGEGGEKPVELGEAQAGKTYVDFLGHHHARIVIGDDGKAAFPANGGSVSVWVQDDAL